ncbi:MAG: sialidase family protein [Candidatus Latescibacteria bacterium]|jgi:sialidase-1|nr:sialidase family protein [Candidatus Latescibacterota bacterium]
MGATMFERVHAIAWPRRDHGYRGRMGSFLQLQDGSLLLSYTDEDIMAVRSTDLGRTWSGPSVLIPGPRPPAQGRLAHPSFLRFDDGQILMSYIYSTHPTTPYYGHNYYRRSDDDGRTWTDQYLMTPHPGYIIVHNDRLFRMSTGRIVALAEYKAYYPDSRDHSGYVGIACFSDDNGYSWQVSENTVDMQPDEVQEPDGVELEDGRVMMFARTYSGFAVRAYSSDGCRTWSSCARSSAISLSCTTRATML